MFNHIKKLLRNTKVRSLIYIALCSLGVLGFLLFAVIPNQLAIKDVEKDIREIETRIARQEILYPLYQQMLLKINRLDKKEKKLPFPEKKALGRNELARINQDFNRAAEKAGMEMEIFPDLVSLTKNSRIMVVNGSARGSFFSFRKLLVELGRLPYLQDIGKIEIKALPEDISYKVKFRLALKQS